MQVRTAARDATLEVLVFVLGAEEYGVDILKVQEIRGYEKVTPAPGERILVIGDGTIALLAAHLAAQWSPAEIVVRGLTVPGVAS